MASGGNDLNALQSQPGSSRYAQSATLDITQIDIYSLQKPELIELLVQYGIFADNFDRQKEELRPLAAKLKNLVKDAKTHKIKHGILRKILYDRIPLSPEEELIYPELKAFCQEVTERRSRYLRSEEAIYANLPPHIYQKPPLEPAIELPSLEDLNGARSALETPPVNENPEPEVHNLQPVNMPNRENLPLINAGSFAGYPTEHVGDFLDQYSLAAESNNWEEATKLKLFPTHLQHSAKIWFNLYKNRNPNPTWDDLEREFRKAFTYAAQADSLSAVMQRKTHSKEDSLLNFFLDVVSTCKRYNPAISDKEVIRYFLQSVRPEYCNYLTTLKNDDLTELESNLLKAESFVTLNSQNKERYQHVASGSKPHTTPNPREGLNHVTFREEDDIRAQLNDLKMMVQGLQTMQLRETSSDRSRDKNYDGQRRSHNQPSRSPRNRSPAVNNSNLRDNTRHKSPTYTQATGSQERSYRDTGVLHKTFSCEICKSNTHHIDRCWFNARNPLALQRGRAFNPAYKRENPPPQFQTPYNGPNRDRFYRRNNVQNDSTLPSPSADYSLTCRYCKKDGHDISQCYKLKNKNNQKNFSR